VSRIATFGVLPVLRGLEGKFSALRIIDARSAKEAMRKADIFADVVGGAVAFSKAGGPGQDQWDGAIILGYCGEVPDDMKRRGVDLIRPAREGGRHLQARSPRRRQKRRAKPNDAANPVEDVRSASLR